MSGKWFMDSRLALPKSSRCDGIDARTLSESDYDRSEFKTSYRSTILYNNQKYILAKYFWLYLAQNKAGVYLPRFFPFTPGR